MSAIYGLRCVGDDEIRYIGRSDRPLEQRLAKHLQNARRNYPPLISAWLRAADAIEIVELERCDRSAAAERERALVAHYHGLGHRLANSHLLPRTPKSITNTRRSPVRSRQSVGALRHRIDARPSTSPGG